LLSFNKPFFFQVIDCVFRSEGRSEEAAWKKRPLFGSDRFRWRRV
jgi:hypothetical protein